MMLVVALTVRARWSEVMMQADLILSRQSEREVGGRVEVV